MGSSKQQTTQTNKFNQVTDQTSSEKFNQNATQSQQTVFDPRSQAEQDILNQYQGLGSAQSNFLQSMMGQGYSPFTLSDADQLQLDKAYDAARNRLVTGGQEYADYLASGRGMSMGSTPVSQQALDRFGMSLQDLESQRAQTGLNMGLNSAQLKLQGANSLPAGLGAAFAPMFNERLAGGRTTSSQSNSGSSTGNFYNSSYGNSTSQTTQRYTPSLMSQIGQGMALGSQAIGLGAQIGGLAMGMPMPYMGGGGSNGGAYYGNSGLDGLSQFTVK